MGRLVGPDGLIVGMRWTTSAGSNRPGSDGSKLAGLMRLLLFRVAEMVGGGGLALSAVEWCRRRVGAARAIPLRRCLSERGSEGHHVVVEGATALVVRDLASGPPSWAGTAGELAAIVESVGSGGIGWMSEDPEIGPRLLIARDSWRDFAGAIHRHGSVSWVVERLGPASPVRPVVRSPRAITRLGAGGAEQRLRVYDAVGDGRQQPFGRGLAVHMTVVERVPAEVERGHELVADIQPPFPVDTVHTWVDGADPAWRRRRARAAELRDQVTADATSEERFASRDELRFSLRSVNTYMPWVRHRYLVTDQQVPRWLGSASDLLTVIDHREIIDDGHLPTFNSHVIEACLHRIPGLAEHYVYFNDDVFLGRALGWRVFFDGEGRSRFFPSPVEVPTGTGTERSIDAATMNGRRLVAQRFGADAANKMRHTAHPQRRTTHLWMESEFAAERRATLGARFRSVGDQSFAAFLHHYVGEQLGLAVSSSVDYDYVGLDRARLALRLRAILRRTDPFDMFCLNDGAVDPADAAEVDRTVREFLETAYPFPAPWEHSSLPSTARCDSRRLRRRG